MTGKHNNSPTIEFSHDTRIIFNRKDRPTTDADSTNSEKRLIMDDKTKSTSNYTSLKTKSKKASRTPTPTVINFN